MVWSSGELASSHGGEGVWCGGACVGAVGLGVAEAAPSLAAGNDDGGGAWAAGRLAAALVAPSDSTLVLVLKLMASYRSLATMAPPRRSMASNSTLNAPEARGAPIPGIAG